jgi:GNAT superfamily N-acetyltransferase
VIRPATERDVEAMVGLVRDLAEYERAADRVRLDADQLRVALFGERPAVFAHVAEEHGGVVGMAIWFLNFSTWTGRHGIWLEDLFVRPEARGAGHGRGLLLTLARLAVASGYGRVEWSVLDWNEPAIGFYRSLGAEAQDEWTTFRLADDALVGLAGDQA